MTAVAAAVTEATGGSQTGTGAVVEVAVGVVIRPDGAVLFGQRVPGKPYAGWWEFPGGKLEAGESVEQALARELHEELGLRVHASYLWAVKRFVYPHASVRLHFQRVFDFSGQPESREGQSFVWQQPDAITVAPLLPAAIPALGWLRLAPVFAISNVAELGESGFLQALEQRLQSGLRLLQLREKTLAPAAFERLFYRVAALCRAARATLLINSDHPRSYWQAADGVHLTAAALAGAGERPPVRLVAASCHDAIDVQRAGRLSCDFAVLGPVLPTASHPAAPALGWAGFERIARDSTVPLFALGGMTLADRAAARSAGAHGIAQLRAAWS